jgi:hypothetical protein
MSMGLRVKCLLFLSHFNQNLIFPTDFRKTLKYQISRTLGGEVFHAEGWTDGQT